jgi:predicted NBD/HSP70 family sugar kinase
MAGPIGGISFAVPGAVDPALGTILFAPNLGWRNVKIFEKLRNRFTSPITVENEASLAALGEHFFGAASGLSEVLYISAGIGVGGGLIVGGEVYRGSSGIAGEFGHMTIDLNGKQCACGKRGCWETLVNEAALFSEFKRLSPKNSRLPKSPPEMIATLLASARDGESRGIEAIRSLGEPLAVGIDSLTKGFDPKLVVLGGPISSLHEFLIPMIREELAKRTIFDLDHSPEIVPSAFGADAALKGGIAAILKSLLRSPVF